MKYTKYTIETTTEAEDILSAVLEEEGIEGIEIADSKPWSQEELDEIFVDEVPVNSDIPEGAALVSFYLSEEENRDELLPSIRRAIEDMRVWAEVPCGSLNISSSDLEDEDYLNSWKQYFHAFDIGLSDGRSLAVIPSWEEPAEGVKADIRLNIDPGTAFGTGAHETTKLCIIELSKYVKPDMRLLDVGTGSGILSMASFMFGAGQITATDIDPNAAPAVEDNFKKNGLNSRRFSLIIGNILSDQSVRDAVGSGYDIIVANILPVVLVPLTPVIKDMLRPSGIIIYSGILNEKAPVIKQTLEDNGFKPVSESSLGEWCVIVAKR